METKHIIPVGGTEPPHVVSRSCWCHPGAAVSAPGILVHNAKDCRERWERQGMPIRADLPWVTIIEATQSAPTDHVKTATEIATLLQPWLDSYLELERQFAVLESVLGRRDDCPLENAAYLVHDAYTAALAREVGDEGDWLSWYLYENDAGKKGLTAAAPKWRELRPITSLRRLAKLIRACQAD